MSTVRADNVSPSAGGTSRNLPRGVAAAWANLNGTGTIALRDSQNISSTTDNGTGDYSFGLTSAMTNTNYAFGGMGTTSVSIGSGERARINIQQPVATSASSARIATYDTASGQADYVVCCPILLGSLA